MRQANKRHNQATSWKLILSSILVVALAMPMLGIKALGAQAATTVYQGIPVETQTSSAEDALLKAQEFNKELAAEGMVLLKNEGNALPLDSNSRKVNLFGKNWNNPAYGGSGSSSFSNNSGAGIDVYQSLESAGFVYNPALKTFYGDNDKSGTGRPSYSYGTTDMITGETPVNMYDASLKNTFAEYDDASIVMVTRVGGEGYDVSPFYGAAVSGRANAIEEHYLMLDDNEKALISLAADTSEKVVLVINAAQPLEFDETTFAKIDAIIWAGLPGSTGFDAVGKILNGSVNPSGRTVDTFAKDFKAMPSYQNFGVNGQATVRGPSPNPSQPWVKGPIITNAGNALYGADGEAIASAEVTYEEGIYIGYRYYETRAYEEDKQQNAVANKWWADNVRYPFGYGLSYTTFEYTNVEFKTTELTKDGEVNVEVTVKNTGTVPGKEVVQLYYSAPYVYDGIEKSHVVLGDFAKTDLLSAGEEDTLTLNLKVKDMASYDYDDKNNNGYKTYELDEGDYKFFVGANAHSWYNAPTSNVATITLDQKINYLMNIDGKTDNKSDNQFEEMTKGLQGTGIEVMSRSDFEGTFPQKPTQEERTVGPEVINAFNTYGVGSDGGVAYDKNKPWFVENMPTQRANALTGMEAEIIKLIELAGKDYNDPLWEDFLNQFTISQLADFVNDGKFTTHGLPELGIPEGINPDGPLGFVGQREGYGSNRCYYVSPSIVAATFNKELVEKQGEYIGEEGAWLGYNGIYAPGVNIHRTPFSGRNFEYYSEDAFLSGIMAAKLTEGMQRYGVIPYIKHFAINDQEQDRNGISTWADEQTAREIYYRAFQIPVESANAMGIMSSFNRIGLTWAGASYELLTNVLRKEWGFKGAVVTDWANGGYMNLDQMIRAGNDFSLGDNQFVTNTQTSNTATHVYAMRQATKNICYMVLNSNVMSKLVNFEDTSKANSHYYINIDSLINGINPVIEFGSQVYESEFAGLTYEITKSNAFSTNVTPVKLPSDLPEGMATIDANTGVVTLENLTGIEPGTYQLTVSIKKADGNYIGQSKTITLEFISETEVISDLLEQIKELKSQITDLKKAQEASNTKIDNLESKINDLASSLDNLKTELLEQINLAIENLDKDMTEILNGVLSKITELQAEIDTIKTPTIEKDNGNPLVTATFVLAVVSTLILAAGIVLLLKKKSTV